MSIRFALKPFGEATTIYVTFADAGNPERFLSGLSFEAGDVTLSLDGASFSEVAGTPVEIDASAVYALSITDSEMSARSVVLSFQDQTDPKEWFDFTYDIETSGWMAASNEIQLWEISTINVPALNTSCEAAILFGTEHTTPNAYKDRNMMFTTGQAGGSPVQIVSSTGQGVGQFFTYSLLQSASFPEDGARFVIF